MTKKLNKDVRGVGKKDKEEMIDKKYEKERGGGRDNLNKEDDRDHISNNNVDETNKNNNNKPGIDVDLTIYNIFLHDLERDVKE